jgi:hypothetical protein
MIRVHRGSIVGTVSIFMWLLDSDCHQPHPGLPDELLAELYGKKNRLKAKLIFEYGGKQLVSPKHASDYFD